MRHPKQVKIVEVSPRDGLQNESRIIPTPVKCEFIDLLSHTGLTTIECTSFVSPKWVPQLSDNIFILEHVLQKHANITYPVLIPNLKGLENALASGVKDIAVFTAASETFNQKNTNCSLAESLDRCAEVITLAKKHHLSIRGYISCVLGCPYEGDIHPGVVANIAEKLFHFGCNEISLGDTIGVGTPLKAQKLIEWVSKKIPKKYLAVHFHDTYGQALANIFAALECGISIIDSSVNGLGGCPYARGASGNVATEDVLYMLNGLGIHTGIEMDKLLMAGKYISSHLHRPPQSKLARVKN
jgi:hydroxymethylglutaryl-CoA lyase